MKKQWFSINGDRYEIGPFTLGTLSWIKQKFKTVEDWNKAIGIDRDASAIAETVFKLISNETRAKFKSAQDLAEAMPGNVNYLTILYLRIMSLYGQDHGEFVSNMEMENTSEDDLKNLNAALEQKTAEAMERLAEVAAKKKAEAQTPTT